MHEEQEDVGSFEDLGLDDRILKVSCDLFLCNLISIENISTTVLRDITKHRNCALIYLNKNPNKELLLTT